MEEGQKVLAQAHSGTHPYDSRGSRFSLALCLYHAPSTSTAGVWSEEVAMWM